MDKSQPDVQVILLVDDNPQNLHVLGKLLQKEKYKIEFAINGEATLEWLKNKQFDLILLDLNMPGMNGFEVCKRIRLDKGMYELPIIFLSAESERETILKGFEAGAQDYITKPFDSRELLARVKTQLDLKSKTEILETFNEWIGKKNDSWLKVSKSRLRGKKINDPGSKLMEFDKNQSLILNDICLELSTSIREIKKIIWDSNNSTIKSHYEEIVKRIEKSVAILEKF